MIAATMRDRMGRTVLAIAPLRLAFITSCYAALPFFRMSWSVGLAIFPLLMLESAIRPRCPRGS